MSPALGGMFGDDSPLADFWAATIGGHIRAMTEAADPPRAHFSHSRVTIAGMDFMMMIGPGGSRGFSPDDWQSLAEQIRSGGDVPDLVVTAFTVLRPPE